MPESDIFNMVDVGHTKGIAHILGEDRSGNRYLKFIAVNINDRERKTDKEIETYPGETPERISALDGRVYVAVDDSSSRKQVRDIHDSATVEDLSHAIRVTVDEIDCVYDGEETYPLSLLCNDNTDAAILPDPCDGYSWTFDTSDEGYGVFRRAKAFTDDQISDTLIPIDRNGRILKVRPDGRYDRTDAPYTDVCTLPDSLKKKPAPPPVIQCPASGESLKLSQFCSGRKINDECHVYEYNTQNATGGREPRVTGYPRNHRVNVSQDVAEITSRGRILRGGDRFSDAISNGDSVCDLPSTLKKKYVPPPPTQTEYTYSEICNDGTALPRPDTGKSWYYVTPTDSNDYGKFTQMTSVMSNTDNRVLVLWGAHTGRISGSSTGRYGSLAGQSICSLSDGLKRGTGGAGSRRTEYSLDEICSRHIQLPNSPAGKRWYFVTVSGDQSYGKFKELDTTQVNDDEHVAVDSGRRSGYILRQPLPKGRYEGYQDVRLCGIPDNLKRGRDNRPTQFNYTSICGGNSSLYNPPAGKTWYFETLDGSAQYGIFYLRSTGLPLSDHRVEVDVNARIKNNATNRYANQKRVKICNMAQALKRGRIETPIEDCYPFRFICESANTMPDPPPGRKWFYATYTDSICHLNPANGNGDPNNMVEVDNNGVIQPTANTLGGRYKFYRNRSICYLAESFRAVYVPPTQTSYELEYLCNSNRGKLPDPPSGKVWYWSTETASTPPDRSKKGKFVLRNANLKLGHDLVELYFSGIIERTKGGGSKADRWFTYLGDSICSAVIPDDHFYKYKPPVEVVRTCPPPGVTAVYDYNDLARNAGRANARIETLPAVPEGYDCKWYVEHIYARGYLISTKYKLLAPQTKLDKYVIGQGGQTLWYTRLREVNRRGDTI